MNETLFLIVLVVNFVGILTAYKVFGNTGLFVWIGFATVVANIEVTKCVDLFGMSLTLGNVIYGTTYLATDILSETMGGKVARKGVAIGFFTTVAFTIMSQINLLFVPNDVDVVSDAFGVIFGFTPQICFASVVAYLVSNVLDTYTFDAVKKRFPRFLWVRNNASTMTSQLVDSFLFTFLAFWGTFDVPMMIELSLTTYAIKVVVAACDTPFLYIARNIYKKRSEGRNDRIRIETAV